MADNMVSWSGARLPIEGFWNPKKGDIVKGILLQRNRNPGGRVNAPFYVLQLTQPCAEVKMKDKTLKLEKGQNIAIAENVNLVDLKELLGYEVQLKLTDITEFATEDGEVREVKQFDVKHSEKVQNEKAAARYRPEASAR